MRVICFLQCCLKHEVLKLSPVPEQPTLVLFHLWRSNLTALQQGTSSRNPLGKDCTVPPLFQSIVRLERLQTCDSVKTVTVETIHQRGVQEQIDRMLLFITINTEAFDEHQLILANRRSCKNFCLLPMKEKSVFIYIF